jgi:hypothetical protein
VRGTFADRIDHRLAAIIGASLAIHLAIATWAWQTDLEHDVPLGVPAVAEQLRQETIDVTIPDAPTVPVTATMPGVAAPASPAQTPRSIVRPPQIAASMPHAPTNDDAARLANILASSDTDAHGPAGMHHRHPGADLEQQLADVRNHRVTIGGGSHTSRVDDRARLGTGTDELPVADPTLTRAPQQHESAAGTKRISLGPVESETRSTLTSDAVLQRIQALYLSGMQRCYARGLATDPSLSGKIAVSFTVDERGHVSDAEASGVDPQVSSCIAALMGSWRFVPPKDKAGDPTDASFRISLALRPS